VPQAFNSGKAALSLGCCGARAYLDVLTDDVALFAIPGVKLQAFTERIEALATANRILTRFHTVRRAAGRVGRGADRRRDDGGNGIVKGGAGCSAAVIGRATIPAPPV
jgi:hypothetical protein